MMRREKGGPSQVCAIGLCSAEDEKGDVDAIMCVHSWSEMTPWCLDRGLQDGKHNGAFAAIAS